MKLRCFTTTFLFGNLVYIVNNLDGNFIKGFQIFSHTWTPPPSLPTFYRFANTFHRLTHLDVFAPGRLERRPTAARRLLGTGVTPAS